MRSFILVFFFTLLLAPNLYGQRGDSSVRRHAKLKTKPASIAPAPPYLDETAAEIREMRPEIINHILIQDSAAVRKSVFTIRRIYAQRKFSHREADDALKYGWTQLRAKVLETTSPLSAEMLINYVSGFGKLTIKSNPAGAVVELDGNKLSNKTATVAWPSAGTYRIKLSIDGYESVEDTCIVEEGKPMTFERKLNRIKRKPDNPPKRP